MGGGVGNPTSLMKGNVGLATPPHQVWVTAKRGHGVGNPMWGWLPLGLGPLTALSRGAFRARRLAVHVWPAGFGGLELGSGAFDLRHERRCEVEGDYNNKKASATQPTTQKLHDD